MPFRNSIVGGNGNLVRESIQSPNFSMGNDDGTPIQGWQIRKDGSAIFNNVTIGSSNYVIDESGAAAFRTLDISENLTVYGVEFLSWLDALPKGIIAYGERNDNATFTGTTEQPFLQLDSTIMPGRLYRISTTPVFVSNDTASGRSILRLRYRTTSAGDATAGLTSAIGFYTRTIGPVAGTAVSSSQLKFHIANTGAQPLNFSTLLTYMAENGNSRIYGNAVYPVTITIEDLGLWPGDTGVDRSSTTPPPTKKTYTTVWNANAHRSYDGNGVLRTDTDKAMHGQYSTNRGNQYSKIAFSGGAASSTDSGEVGKAMTTALAGATLEKLEVYLMMERAYGSAGGTATIRASNGALDNSVPSGAAVTGPTVTEWRTAVGRWIDITSLSNVNTRGISLGKSPTTSPVNYLTFYGATGSDSVKAKFRARYTR